MPRRKRIAGRAVGRSARTEYLSELAMAAIKAAEKALETIIRPQELRLLTPQAFNPQANAKGAYWR